MAYEPGAEPYDDNLVASGLSIWWLLEENLNALFLGRSNAPSITVPKKLNQFNAIPAQNKTSWTGQEIMDLAARERTGISSSGHNYFWVVFLKGNFHNGTSLQPQTIGVNFQGTSVIAIFKDVVEGTATGNGTLDPKYVKQSTLIHELGQALGLVNTGLPPKTAHEDPAHRAHCNDPDCVMYWSNEGTSDMVNFVKNAITSGSVIMYDGQCLKDSREY